MMRTQLKNCGSPVILGDQEGFSEDTEIEVDLERDTGIYQKKRGKGILRRENSMHKGMCARKHTVCWDILRNSV